VAGRGLPPLESDWCLAVVIAPSALFRRPGVLALISSLPRFGLRPAGQSPTASSTAVADRFNCHLDSLSSAFIDRPGDGPSALPMNPARVLRCWWRRSRGPACSTQIIQPPGCGSDRWLPAGLAAVSACRSWRRIGSLLALGGLLACCWRACRVGLPENLSRMTRPRSLGLP